MTAISDTARQAIEDCANIHNRAWAALTLASLAADTHKASCNTYDAADPEATPEMLERYRVTREMSTIAYQVQREADATAARATITFAAICRAEGITGEIVRDEFGSATYGLRTAAEAADLAHPE
jgi:hypothetical protein